MACNDQLCMHGNNLYNMEYDLILFFIDIKHYFGKRLIITGGEPGTKISNQQISIKKRSVIIKSKIYNFMYANEMNIKIGYITNIFLRL